MTNFIDGFVFPTPKEHLVEYKRLAEKVADIWKEYGALAYFEYMGDDLSLEGIRSFAEVVKLKEDEVVIFGWVVFSVKSNSGFCQSAGATGSSNDRIGSTVNGS